MKHPSEEQVLRLVVEVGCSATTVRRWLSGASVSAAADYGLRAAAKKLRIKTKEMKR